MSLQNNILVVSRFLFKAGFVKVDHDYVVSVAKIAHETGCQHFTVVSALGADKNSIILFRKTKVHIFVVKMHKSCNIHLLILGAYGRACV